MASLEQRLSALAEGASALAGELDFDHVLEVITTSAAEVTGARYAALGVLGEDDRIERFVTHGADQAMIDAIGHYPTGHGLLGLLIRDPRIVRLDDLTTHPVSTGFPPGHPHMTSFLGAPVRSGGQVFGNLYLTDKPGGFDDTDEHLVAVLAAQAGAAVENAQLARRLRQLAVQDERDRISRELHDGVIQSLFSIGMGLQSARGLLPADAARVDERLETATEGLDAAIRELRAAIFRLRPPASSELALASGLADLAREYEANALLRPELHVPQRVAARIPSSTVPDALAIVREALFNVTRHAEAARVRISADLADGQVLVTVADDGQGFAADAQASAGYGLANMRQRAAALGADLRVDSAPGEGTRVVVSIPVEGHADE